VRAIINTRLPRVSNGNDEETREPENIFVTMAIGLRLELAKFPQDSRAPFWVPVRAVYPCPRCNHPIATIRLGREVKTVDCVENPFSPLPNKWECDVVNDHACGLGGLQ
jgi:hypothetical protein